MNFKVTATASTQNLMKAISRFGKPQKMNSGKLLFIEHFDTEEQAINFLVRKAENFYTHTAELREAIDDILVYGCLTIDSVTAHIEKVTN